MISFVWLYPFSKPLANYCTKIFSLLISKVVWDFILAFLKVPTEDEFIQGGLLGEGCGSDDRFHRRVLCPAPASRRVLLELQSFVYFQGHFTIPRIYLYSFCSIVPNSFLQTELARQFISNLVTFSLLAHAPCSISTVLS